MIPCNWKHLKGGYCGKPATYFELPSKTRTKPYYCFCEEHASSEKPAWDYDLKIGRATRSEELYIEDALRCKL